MKTPTNEDVECLIHWPKGSVGYEQEKIAVETLLSLCKKHGFGRIPQLAEWINEIWSDPLKTENFKKIRKENFKSLGWKVEV